MITLAVKPLPCPNPECKAECTVMDTADGFRVCCEGHVELITEETPELGAPCGYEGPLSPDEGESIRLHNLICRPVEPVTQPVAQELVKLLAKADKTYGFKQWSHQQWCAINAWKFIDNPDYDESEPEDERHNPSRITVSTKEPCSCGLDELRTAIPTLKKLLESGASPSVAIATSGLKRYDADVKGNADYGWLPDMVESPKGEWVRYTDVAPDSAIGMLTADQEHEIESARLYLKATPYHEDRPGLNRISDLLHIIEFLRDKGEPRPSPPPPRCRACPAPQGEE